MDLSYVNELMMEEKDHNFYGFIGNFWQVVHLWCIRSKTKARFGISMAVGYATLWGHRYFHLNDLNP